MSQSKKVVAICVATYKRPELLVNCIESIRQIEIPETIIPIIIVVDNDKDRTAESSFTATINKTELDAYYYVEPDRGICSARNCLLEKALQHNADYIAFVDDDELAHSLWLVNMIKGLEKYKCEITAGPVIPIYETTPPLDFTTDPKRPAGMVPRNIPAGNVLFDTKLIKELELRFDRYFDFIGCEDFDFFDRAVKMKMKSVWLDDAIIFETITPDRQTRKYLMHRHLTGGINVVMRFRRHHSLLHAWLRYLPKALGKFIGAFCSIIMAIFISREQNVNKFIIKLFNGAGYICGLTNIIIERYRY